MSVQTEEYQAHEAERVYHIHFRDVDGTISYTSVACRPQEIDRIAFQLNGVAVDAETGQMVANHLPVEAGCLGALVSILSMLAAIGLLLAGVLVCVSNPWGWVPPSW